MVSEPLNNSICPNELVELRANSRPPANTNRSGHCYLMMDDLQQAYAAYQNALINLRNPKVRDANALAAVAGHPLTLTA